MRLNGWNDLPPPPQRWIFIPHLSGNSDQLATVLFVHVYHFWNGLQQFLCSLFGFVACHSFVYHGHSANFTVAQQIHCSLSVFAFCIHHRPICLSHSIQEMSGNSEVDKAYERLQQFVDARPKMRQTHLLQQTNQLMAKEWDVIREYEESKLQNTKIKKHWKTAVLLNLAAPGRFVHGGDRKSLRWRNHHGALVQFVEKYIEPATADDSDEVVKNKFQAASSSYLAPYNKLAHHQQCVVETIDMEFSAEKADVEKEAEVNIPNANSNRSDVETEAKVKITELQMRRASYNAKIARAKAKTAASNAKIAECRLQLYNNKREREETTESTTAKVTKQPNIRKPLAERLAAHIQTYYGAMSFSHAVYERIQDLSGDIDIVTLFQHVQLWCKVVTCRRFLFHGPRDLDSVIIVYCNQFSDALLQQAAIDCLAKTPMKHSQSVVVASFKPVSLLFAVIDVLPYEQRTIATNLLINVFLCDKRNEPWHGVTCFIVQSRVTQEIEDITTYVDVGNHPIVTKLRDWLCTCTVDGGHPAPPVWSDLEDIPICAYPANAGLGSFNAYEAHTELMKGHTAVDSWLMKYITQLYTGYEHTSYLADAVHPEQTVVCFFVP